MRSSWILLLLVVMSWVMLCWFIFTMGVRVGQQLPCETDMECEQKCGVQI